MRSPNNPPVWVVRWSNGTASEEYVMPNRMLAYWKRNQMRDSGRYPGKIKILLRIKYRHVR